jgi:neutral ceramidase
MLEIGAARTEITAYEPRLGMMGWGMVDNVVERVATPLHARAFFVRDPASGRTQAIAICELAFISLALREEVMRRLAEHPDLGLDYVGVLLAGTHTHSGPGGFTHYAFYNVTIPGFSLPVLQQLASGIVDAIVTAAARRQPATIRYGEATFGPELEVAFNRSIDAYNRNPEVDPVSAAHRHLAVDRTLRLVRFDTPDGRPIGSLNWFSVHCTSVHSDNTALHFDNKGYAAQFVEEALVGDHPGYVAAFAQGAPGDVTPNFKRHAEKRWLRGKYPDDDESARWHGRLQADRALEALAQAERAQPMTPRLLHAHAFADFSRIDVDPRFVAGESGRRTGPAEIGMAMFFGTEEGPGLPRQLVFLQNWLAAARPHVRRWVAGRDAAAVREHEETQAEKIPWVETGRRRLLGIRHLRRIPLPWRMTAALRMVRSLDRDDPDAKPWTPAVLPVHLVVLGDVAMCAVPAEFTTIAARRLCEQVVGDLAGIGVTAAVLAGYANAYAGYVTTPQEYALQDYEGASTHFGKWTLPAYQTEFARLCEVLLGTRKPADDLRPPTFDATELEAFPA